MKHYLLFVSILLCCLVEVTAQEQVVQTVSSDLAVSSQRTNTNKSVAYYYRHHKSLPALYSGFIIEIKKTALPLRRDHKLFKQFGSVFIDRLPQGGYSYGIPVDFSTRYDMKKYLKEVVQPKASEARIVRYKNGIRKSS